MSTKKGEGEHDDCDREQLMDDNLDKDTEIEEEPKDEYNLVYLTFLFYGIAVLLPWNAITSVWDFF